MKRLCIDCQTRPRLAKNERCEPCYTRYLASFNSTLSRTPLVSRSQTRSTSQPLRTTTSATSFTLVPHSFSEREKELFDEAVQRGMALGRPFTEREVFQNAWNEGYELTPAQDERFALYQDGTKKQMPLWTINEVRP